MVDTLMSRDRKAVWIVWFAREYNFCLCGSCMAAVELAAWSGDCSSHCCLSPLSRVLSGSESLYLILTDYSSSSRA